MADNNTLNLSDDAEQFIKRQIRQSAIWFGLSLLGLNFAAGAAAIWAFWSTTYQSAKDEYGARLEILQKTWEAEKTTLSTELRKQHRDELDLLEAEIDDKFDYKYVKEKLTNVTLTAGRLEHQTEMSSTKASASASQAEEIACLAKETAESALEKSNAALGTAVNAEDVSRQISEAFANLENSDLAVAESLKQLKDLGKAEPLGQIVNRIAQLENSSTSETDFHELQQRVESLSKKAVATAKVISGFVPQHGVVEKHGFTSIRQSTGNYLISFADNRFKTPPTVVACIQRPVNKVSEADNNTIRVTAHPNGCTVHIRDLRIRNGHIDPIEENAPFYFVAISSD